MNCFLCGTPYVYQEDEAVNACANPTCQNFMERLDGGFLVTGDEQILSDEQLAQQKREADND